jgi:hypothetical protein
VGNLKVGWGQLTLAMKTSPPDMRQKAEMSSVGGRDGRSEVGGEM